MNNSTMGSASDIKAVLERVAPTVYRSLSPLGRRAFYPRDIPFQAQQARDAEINGTIGIFTDGHGNAVPLPSMSEVLNLDLEDRNRAFLYAPVSGIPELRQRWREWQREGMETDGPPSSLPLVTVGLAHGLSIVADLFGGEGRPVAIPSPFWGNYRQIFHLRTGAEVVTAPAYHGGRLDTDVYEKALGGHSSTEPAIVLVNFPSNPGGYSPSVEETNRLTESLLRIADQRPLVVVCDDAYGGFVFDDRAPRASLFWRLAGAHPQLLAVKVDGGTKEFAFFGGRVGFLTFGCEPDSELAAALENKVMCLIRSTVGSSVATSQVVMLQALRSGRARHEIDEIWKMAHSRYCAIQPALAELDPRLIRILPFNAGFFALLELPEELHLDADVVRRYLLAEHRVGVVSIGSRYLRIATCSVTEEDLPQLVKRVEKGVRELAEGAGAFREVR